MQAPAIEARGLSKTFGVIARDVPLAEIRRLRKAGAEVWPGAWHADRIAIVDEPKP